MNDNLTSKYGGISLTATGDLSKVRKLFDSNNAGIKYDWFHFFASKHGDSQIFAIQSEAGDIGIIALYDIDTVNSAANMYGFVTEKMYYSDLLKSLLSLMEYAFMNLQVNKLNFIYREDNYFFDDVVKHLQLVNEGTLRNRLKYDGEYYNVSTYGILAYEFKRLVTGVFKKMYTWDYDFTPDKFTQIDITGFMNNRAFTNDITNPNDADLNYLREFVLNKNTSAEKLLSYKNAKFAVNIFDANLQYDNVVCEGQEIEIDEGCYSDLLIVTMAQFGCQKADITLVYEDGYIECVDFNVSDWCERVLQDEYIVHYASGCIRLNKSVNIVKCDSFIYLKRIGINPSKKLKRLIFPKNRSINIFAVGICRA